MKCLYCVEGDTKVIDTREVGDSVRRRRECLECEQRFTTYERAAAPMMVVKRDGRREEFDRDKLIEGLRKACAKRPISMEAIEGIAKEIEMTLYGRAGTEVESRLIGQMVMERLRELEMQFHQERQSSITAELLDIVAGAEALRDDEGEFA